MSQQNINQYVYKKINIDLVSDNMDMSLASDERDYKEEVIFSPYIIAQTYGNKLPFYFDINDSLTAQKLNLKYKNYNKSNIFVSQNYYNPENSNFCFFTASTSCDIGFTGIDNGLVDTMSGQTIYFTNGIFEDGVKFDRMYYDRRLKLFQVTGHTTNLNRFEAFGAQTLYEVISKTGATEGVYHELYGGFYQGFYKLFGFDYNIFPERMNKGWSVELLLKPRLCNEYLPSSGETTLNGLYPNNKNTFFYWGTRAENKFYHYADGTPRCFTGYTRVTTPLANCLQTCACCNLNITNSRCIYLYPPRSLNGIHDPHINYGCGSCKGNPMSAATCGCGCNQFACETCGWECQTHYCGDVIQPTPTPTPLPSPTPSCDTPLPECTPTCTTCDTCLDCLDCPTSGFTSVEDTCEKDPLLDSMSNNISFKLCGDPQNPGIGIKVLRFTGECITTGNTVTGTGTTFVTGYTIQEWCTPPIYSYCEQQNPAFIEQEHWFLLDVVWKRYTNLDNCDLWWFGGLGDITKKEYLESLANNSFTLIAPPYSNGKKESEQIETVKLNDSWLLDEKYRKGKLLIYVNGKLIYTIKDFEELIPRALPTDKEKQVGVPFNISWGGGTQGLHENLVPSTCENLSSDFIQDPELFPTSVLSGTSLSGLTTNILLEKEFGGTFEGGISQFRMYVQPLDSSEIRHNFNILKDKFRLFNPFCPDCDTEICLTNDFTYTISGETEITPSSASTLPFELGRIYVEDKRDLNYLIKNNQKVIKPISTKPQILTQRFWDANGWWGNQGALPQCVGYSWSHWLEDGPIQQSGKPPVVHPSTIYFNAQKLDQWPGENYNGTSVRGGVKYLQQIGKVKSYYWAFDLPTLVNTVLKVGPVVVGTNWYNGMFSPDKSGNIRVTGRFVGGHAYVINGVDLNKKVFRIKNSWGKSWGLGGHAYISFNDMTRLIRENGEICLATEIGS